MSHQRKREKNGPVSGYGVTPYTVYQDATGINLLKLTSAYPTSTVRGAELAGVPAVDADVLEELGYLD
jgi:hypothetical protein